MAKLPTSRPAPKDIKASVFRGLSIREGLTPDLVTYITFSPTLGIAAGRIDKLGMDIRSFREPLKRAIQQVIIPSMRTNFDVSGRPSWEPLSQGTIDFRTRRGLSQSLQPLIRTGALRRTMGYFNIWKVTPNMAVLADLPSNVWYGAIHQAGFSGSGAAKKVVRPSKKTKLRDALIALEDKAYAGESRGGVPPIPARPFAVLQPEDEDRITEIFIEWLGERVDAAWPVV